MNLTTTSLLAGVVDLVELLIINHVDQRGTKGSFIKCIQNKAFEREADFEMPRFMSAKIDRSKREEIAPL